MIVGYDPEPVERIKVVLEDHAVETRDSPSRVVARSQALSLPQEYTRQQSGCRALTVRPRNKVSGKLNVPMREVHDRLHVASDRDCFHEREGWSVVHACKNPCHQDAVGYYDDLDPGHPNYLTLEEETNLYMNILDPARPLFMAESFHAFLDFATKRYARGDELLIHCNEGLSRSPSLALLFLAKELAKLPDGSYWSAWEAYRKLDPHTSPSRGIRTYLRENWEKF